MPKDLVLIIALAVTQAVVANMAFAAGGTCPGACLLEEFNSRSGGGGYNLKLNGEVVRTYVDYAISGQSSPEFPDLNSALQKAKQDADQLQNAGTCTFLGIVPGPSVP